MIPPIRGLAHREDHGWGTTIVEELDMKWETPQAIELRFGMEITMYVSHR